MDKPKLIETGQPSQVMTPLRKLLAHIELADPVTWVSGTTLVICGAIASGSAEGFRITEARDIGLVALGALMAGPLGTGFSQSINDYFDRDLDAINDPRRPIPSGRLTLREAQVNITVLGAATLLVSLVFQNLWITLIAILALILAALYSVPPIKLKQNFWLGPPAVGVGYVVLSWIAGHLIFTTPTAESVVAAIINGGLGMGILLLNDIKSIDGDRQLGMQSITVAMGLKKALLAAFGVINGFLMALILLSLLWGHNGVAAFTVLALVVPLYAQVKLYRNPTYENFKRYLLASNPFILLIQIVTALVVGGYINW